MNKLTEKELTKNRELLELKPYSRPALERQGKWSFATGSGVGICFQGCTQNLFFPEWFKNERDRF